MSGMILGIDAGSVSLSAVLLDESGEIRGSFCRAHEGNIREALTEMERELQISSPFLPH